MLGRYMYMYTTGGGESYSLFVLTVESYNGSIIYVITLMRARSRYIHVDDI